MSYSPRLLACDFDGTLAQHGCVYDSTLDAIGAWKEAGNYFSIITGRMVEDLLGHFPREGLLDFLAAEDGSVTADPFTGEITDLGGPPSEVLVDAMRRREIPLETGRVVIYSRRDREDDIREAIAEAGGRHHMVFNFNAVMILPHGLHKGAGLATAAKRLSVPISQTIAVGDAENDAPLLSAAGFPVAVANALPSLRRIAKLVTKGERGAGVEELIAHLLSEGAGR